MAQGNQNGALWAASAARAKYTVHGGVPYIGISPEEGDGYIVPLPAPSWFHQLDDEGQRDNVFRALAAHALRVGQAKVKSEKVPTKEHAEAGAKSVIDGTYKPGREVDSGIVENEAARMFAEHVKAKVLAVKSDATPAQIDATVAAQADTDAGKALMAKFRGEILERGTYAVSRKGKTKGVAISVNLA